MKEIYGGITTVQGFRSTGVKSGIKTSGDMDMAMIVSDEQATAAGVFTTNKVKSAPVLVSMEHIKSGKAQAIVANSGNANACTGEKGIQNARKMAELAALALRLPPNLVLVASTGKIGRPLPMDKIEQGIKLAASELSYDGGHKAARAIMTTDTFPKESSAEFDVKGKKARIGGIVKGAGMIDPTMATMLCFIITDVAIEQNLLQEALKEAVNKSFNMICVDGDMSTNDTVIILANGKAGNDIIDKKGSDYDNFCEAITFVTTSLAKMIAKDGEGATKFVELRIKGAKNDEDAIMVGHNISRSPLVKTAIFGEDPNWGRLMASLGSSGADVNQFTVDIWFDDLKIVENSVSTGFKEEEAKEIMKNDEFIITIDLKLGQGQAIMWTCDFSYDYVKINIT